MGRTVLILGAGIGGIVAAETLRKLLPGEDRVVVIDRAAEHVFPPSLLWLMVGDRKSAQISRPLSRIERHGVEFIQGNITRIDPAGLTVDVDGRPLSGDAIIIALGAEYAPESIPGLREAGHCIYTPDGAAAIHGALERFAGGRMSS